MNVFLRKISLRNFLSYGSSTTSLTLQPLNILIGANASGKSNFLEAVSLLRSAPARLPKRIREGGGIREWLWKGSPDKSPEAALAVELAYPPDNRTLTYALSFSARGEEFVLVDERIGWTESKAGSRKSAGPVPQNEENFYYKYNHGLPLVRAKGQEHPRSLPPESVFSHASILSQLREPGQYPELTYLADNLSKIKLYREWTFGRQAAPRMAQRGDLPTDALEENGENLGLVLNALHKNPGVKKRLLKSLRQIYDGIDDYDVRLESNSVQVFFHERGRLIPANRLSDGTLRYLSLQAVLLHPDPPPLICLEEPELGLHPDVVASVADLLREASARCQLIVATHSEILVDALTDYPQAVIICEQQENGSTLKRLDKNALKPWLEKYRLGALWLRGDLGGTRW
jgi:predicted ATPase